MRSLYFVGMGRRLIRDWKYTALSITSLSTALSSILLISLFIHHEYSFDQFNEKGGHIYRVMHFMHFDHDVWNPHSSGELAPMLRTSVVGVDDAVRMGQFCGSRQVEMNGTTWKDLTFLCTESNVFNIFSFNLLAGDPESALDRPFTGVVTRSLALKLFGTEDVLGKSLPVYFYGEERPFEITGVVADPPAASHLYFDALLSFSSYGNNTTIAIFAYQFWTYVLLHGGVNPAVVESRIQRDLEGTPYREMIEKTKLQPLFDIYFSGIEAPRMGSRSVVRFLVVVTILILLIACANYVNITTARAGSRIREIGIRKALGGTRRQLSLQFLAESILLALLSLPVSALVVFLFLPEFNELAQSNVVLTAGSVIAFVAFSVALSAAAGVAGGAYPSIYLSSLLPSQALRKALSSMPSPDRIRKLLVIGQFFVSTVLIVAALVAYSQLSFMRNMDPGFDASRTVVASFPYDPETLNQLPAVEQELRSNPAVRGVTNGYRMPGQYRFDFHMTRFASPVNGDSLYIVKHDVDAAFVPLFGLQLVAGRNIRNVNPTSSVLESLLNETAARAFGFASPADAVGAEIGGTEVVGIVKDFHFAPARERIKSLMLSAAVKTDQDLAIKTTTDIDASVLASIRASIEQVLPGTEVYYEILEDELKTQYGDESRAATIFGIFAALAVGLACLGLYGLVAFVSERRTKEIGIRKVMGATRWNLLVLLTGDFARLVLIAFVLAVPMAYVGIQKWLDDFPYRAHIGVGVYLGAGTLLIGIVLLTTTGLMLKAAATNPADALRYE